MRWVVLCSGQAGQRSTMLDELLGSPDDHDVLAVASRVLGQDVATWWRSLDEQAIFANAAAQFAIALYQVAGWQRLAPHLPAPLRVAGYSLGELIAWHVAGSLDVEETLRLVAIRARLMDQAAPPLGQKGCLLLWRGRLAPQQRQARDQALAELGLTVAIHRPGDELVIGGPAAALDQFVAQPALCNPQCVRLPVTLPSHTPWLASAVKPWAQALAASALTDAAVPVVAGIDGRLLRKRDEAISALSRQVAEPLRWDWINEELAALEAEVYFELGPGNDLSKQLQTLCPDSRCRSADEFSSSQSTLEWMLSSR